MIRAALLIVLSSVLGCDRPTDAASAQGAAGGGLSANGLPVVVVDALHEMTENGRHKPYALQAAHGIVLDATRFKFRDPAKLLRAPNSVHVIFDQSLYVADWPTSGTQSITLSRASLRPLKGPAFAGFGEGKQAYIAIGFEEISAGEQSDPFTPFWMGSLLFQ